MRHNTTIQQAIASQRARNNKRKGDSSEQTIITLMRCLHFTCIRRIETGWKVKRHPVNRKIIGAIPIASVAGDIRAVWGAGMGVLVEAKHRKDNILSWGDLEDHQHASLTEHKEAGAMSLIGFTCPRGVALFEYGDPELAHWAKGRPLKWDEIDEAFMRLKVNLEFPRA